MKKRATKKFGNRLVILTMTVCSIAVILACACFILFQLSRLRPNATRTAKSIAEMTALHCYAAVAFDDRIALKETLSSIKAIPEIEWVSITNAQGFQLEQYSSHNIAQEHVHSHTHHFSEINIQTPIMHGKQTIGILELHYDLKPALMNLAFEFMVILFIGLGAIAISAMVAMHKHKELIKPIHALTQAAHRVSSTGNYSLRVNHPSDEDEVGLLIEVFNSMLGKVQHAYDELEQRVDERTFQLNEALGQATAASQAKSLFLANMSHEIRTPMTAILGFSDILQEPDLSDADRNKYLQTIERNGKHLLTIINDILDISKIEADQMQIEHIEMRPLDILHDVQSLMQVKAYEKQLKLDIHIQAPFPQNIHSDPIRIRQVLVNLLSNAIKFTEAGGTIQLTAGLKQNTGEGESLLSFAIHDNGIGMTPQQAEKIFLPFTQADESTTRRFGGTGLGLAISCKLANLLGGNLTVDSVLGQGSTFTFNIATGPVMASDMIHSSGSLGQLLVATETVEHTTIINTQPATADLSGHRILLAEDGIDNQKLIGLLLRREGLEMLIVENGQLAVDAIHEAQSNGKTFDLVLMDMQMPVLDGYAATRQLRRENYQGPIVALTANAMNQDRDACLKAGCDDYMTKPVSKKALMNMVHQFIDVDHKNDEQAA